MSDTPPLQQCVYRMGGQWYAGLARPDGNQVVIEQSAGPVWTAKAASTKAEEMYAQYLKVQRMKEEHS